MVEIEKRYPKIVCIMKKIENSDNNSTDNGDENYLQPHDTKMKTSLLTDKSLTV